MKKTLFFAIILLLSGITRTIAGGINIVNNSSCSVTLNVLAHDAVNWTGCAFLNVTITLGPGANRNFADVDVLNACLAPIHWQGVCMSPSPGVATAPGVWDFVEMPSSGPGVGRPGNCGNAGAGWPQITNSPCGGTNNFTWTTLPNGDVRVEIQ